MNAPIFSIAMIAAVCAACTPTLDWREFVPAGTDISVSFPCRPDRQARSLVLAGAVVRMEMLACSAGGMTFALAFADVAGPSGIGSSLAALRDDAISNVQGAGPRTGKLELTGMTPNDNAGRLSFSGHLPDGAAVRESAAFFARGMRVYQASVIGADPGPGAVDTFIGGFKFPLSTTPGSGEPGRLQPTENP